MAWSHVQSISATNSGATTLTATLGTTPVTGNKIIVWSSVGSSNSSTISSCVDGNSNSLTNLASATETGTSDANFVLFAYDVPATPSKAFKVTYSSSSSSFSIVVQEVSGLATGNTSAMLDGSAGTNHTEGTSLSATYSSTALNEYLTTAFGDDGSAINNTVPTGYTADTNNVNSSFNANVLIGYKNSTNGSESNSWSWSGTDDACVITVAFKLSGGGGTQHNLTATATPSSTGALVRTINATKIATVTSTTKLIRQVGKSLLASVTSTASATKGLLLTALASVTSSSTVTSIKVKLLTVLASVTTSGALVRQIGKVAQATPSSTVKIIKALSPTIKASVSSTTSLTRQVGKTLLASVTSTAASSQIKAKLVVAAASVSSTASLIRQVAPTYVASVTSSVTLIRGLSKTITAVPSTAGSAFKQIAKKMVATATSISGTNAQQGSGINHPLTLLASVISTVLMKIIPTRQMTLQFQLLDSPWQFNLMQSSWTTGPVGPSWIMEAVPSRWSMGES